MRRSIRLLAIAATVACGSLISSPNYSSTCCAQASVEPSVSAEPTVGKTNVPIRKVVLFSSGVGYFEHSGSVEGDASTQLQFGASQINDVLKSLVLEDSGGNVSSVSYASQDPLDKTLKSFQVDITADPSLDQLLNQLRGAKVTVALPTEQVDGTILGVEKRLMPAGNNKPYESAVLNLVSDGAIRSIGLSDIRNIRLDDPELQDELTKALAALAGARDQDKKPVTIHFSGQGKRDVLMGYVVQTPVWKTSYRLVLGGANESQGKLQGWAIVENQTDNDWNDVQLSLVSGRPISFIEDLYQPLYVDRPTVGPQQIASVGPQIYESGIVAQQMAAANTDGNRTKSAIEDSMAGEAAAPMDITQSIQAIASTAKIGELFQYSIGKVNLPRQSSAMLPIVTDPIEVQKISIYNRAVLVGNPLNGARLKNTTGKHLLGGPLTVFEADSYAGDAQIDDLPPGQDRLISYGIDLQTHVDSTSDGGTDETLTAKIVGGVLQVTHQYVMTTVYDAQNKSDHDKTLLIEHPFQQGDWKLIDTPDPVEKTDLLDRFEEVVPAGKTADFVVKERRIADETFAMTDGDIDSTLAYVKNGAIPQKVKEALQKAAAMKQSLADLQRQMEADQAREQGIVSDQSRIDQTLRTISENTQLYARLLEKLNKQESELDKLRSDESDLTQQTTDQQKQLADYLSSLNVG